MYFAAVFTDLVRHSAVWNRVSRDNVTSIIAEYRYLSQSLASQYGRRHENFTGDGHLYLFESADVAVHFGLKLLAYWKQRRRFLVAVPNGQDLPMRVGCHFGECSQMIDGDAWIGRALNIAKRVESCAKPDTLFVTQTILELIDLPIYDLNEVGLFELSGDFLPNRQLYHVCSVDRTAEAGRPEELMTAEDWFLRGGELADVTCAGSDQELECYNRAIRMRPNYPEAHNNLGIVLRLSGDIDGSEKHYMEALRLWPGYPEAHYNYAILLEGKGDLRGAMMHYSDALRLRPTYVDARLRYAGLLHFTGNSGEAGQYYGEVLRLRPGFAEAHNNYAVFLENSGDTVAAERHYLEALRQRPDYAEAHYNLAMLLEVGDRERAEEHYRAAIRALPGYAEAHNNLAVLLHENGDLAAAESHYLQALRVRPNDPGTNYNLALMARAKGDDDGADRYFRRAEELTARQ
jgi:tetratricopeptide (TPR) repeat protein